MYNMPSKKQDNKKLKAVTVRQHPRKVPVSAKNPRGITIVDRHLRHIDGKYLDLKMIHETFDKYDKEKIIYPSKKSLNLTNENIYDDYIAVWTDYFNRKIKLKDPLDPNLIKALVASESRFNPNATNKQATGLTQVTTDTLKILHNLEGEANDFVFKDIRKKDLKDPNVSIAVGTRWLFYKKQYAEKILKRAATSDEVIQVYKGILRDKSEIANEIMKDFRSFYEKLKK